MQKIKRTITLIFSLAIFITISKPVTTYGSSLVPKTIRVGLRSAYRDKPSIEIKNTRLDIGHQENDRFQSQGTLISNTGFMIRPSQKQYYSGKEMFSTYNEAAFSLIIHKEAGTRATVAYIGPGNWKVYFEQDLGDMIAVRSTGQEIMVQDSQGGDLLLCENMVATPAFAGKSSDHVFHLTQLTQGTYRGWFEFVRQGSSITAVNILDYEEYLYGVIPAEMPASWNMEALKAQAVAARSMAIHQYNKYNKYGHNVCDTVYTQVYKGFSGEHARTNQAVDETRGRVATYNGKIAETLFFSTSGGYTEDPANVWGSAIPYLKSIPDPYETDPEMKPWTRTISLADLDQSLASNNIRIGQAKGLQINGYTPAGRVKELEIIGTLGSHKIEREAIRTFFSGTSQGSLRSRLFTIDNAPAINRASSNTLKGLQVYMGSAADYIIGASGDLKRVGRALDVQGAKGQTTYAYEAEDLGGGQMAYGDLVISGKGYGHGVGMSQSGARGMAQAGHTYDQIIKYYYQGVELQ